MRLQHWTRVTLGDGRGVRAGERVKARGGRWHGRVGVFKKAGWRDTHLSLRWDKAGKEPWILAAPEDGPAGLQAVHAYAKRNGCEQSFRDQKSGGFRWAQSHVREPERATKRVLVMTRATLLSIRLGTWLLKSGRRRDLDPHRRRRLSLFPLGLRWLHPVLVLAGDCAVPPFLPYLHPS